MDEEANGVLGGNDYEIYTDSRVIGHAVTNPEHTIKELHKLFEL